MYNKVYYHEQYADLFVSEFGQDVQSNVSPLLIPWNKRLRINDDRSLKQVKRIKIQLNLL